MDTQKQVELSLEQVSEVMSEVMELRSDCIDMIPRDEDWSELYSRSIEGDGDFETLEAFFCDECYNTTLEEFEEENEEEGIEEVTEEQEDEAEEYATIFLRTWETECPNCGEDLQNEGPMMNYWYPLPYSWSADETDADSIIHLPLCLVCVDGRWGLALTGGGMDLSREICWGFIKLGFLPPVHFSGLPRMAEGIYSEERALKLALLALAMERSLEIKKTWANNSSFDANQWLGSYGVKFEELPKDESLPFLEDALQTIYDLAEKNVETQEQENALSVVHDFMVNVVEEGRLVNIDLEGTR